MGPSLLAVFTTVGSEADAQAMARAMVERGLAACAQVTAIDSWYRWQGALQHGPEWRILFKTVDVRRAELEAAIRAQHGYELPALWSQPLVQVDPAYAAWIADSCAGATP